jgi:hypothetical protein
MSIPCHTPSTQSNCASDERGYWKIRVRQDTAENWLKNDPILASGEMGYVIGKTDGPNLKIGDGWVKWSRLPWLVDGQGTGGSGSCGSHIVSDVEPPPGDEIGDLWIYPDNVLTVTPNLPFSNANPPVYLDPPAAVQVNGLPIGLSADGLEYHEPIWTGGVPVMVNGVRYLTPLFPAPPVAAGASAAVLFTFADPPITQTLDGTHIGLSPDGQTYTEPYYVGAIPVIVGGVRYLMPLWKP